MRKVIASLFVVSLLSLPATADQARSGGGAGKPGISACAVLTKELATKVSGAAQKRVFDLPPEEETVGNGSACEYGDIRLQIDAVSADAIERAAKEQKRGAGSSRAANWVPVPGVGDSAYFNTGDRNFAELMGYVGSRTFTIQIGIPFQSTAENMKPNAIALANAVIPKLR